MAWKKVYEVNINNSNDESGDTVMFQIPFIALLQCLTIFDGCSNTPGATSTLKMTYRGYGHPLNLILEEEGVLTDCQIRTQEAIDVLNFVIRDDEMSFKIIMKALELKLIFAELDSSSEYIELKMSSEPQNMKIVTRGDSGMCEGSPSLRPPRVSLRDPNVSREKPSLSPLGNPSFLPPKVSRIPLRVSRAKPSLSPLGNPSFLPPKVSRANPSLSPAGRSRLPLSVSRRKPPGRTLFPPSVSRRMPSGKSGSFRPPSVSLRESHQEYPGRIRLSAPPADLVFH
ncbi:uncharacterized protein LOC103515469 [Diaphorina citri]|uniref:Uncharacterized protein LOC103515469 n=1 Tax=Diaphorina citri TaxID=121845 RepID=A0A3Q0J663_DIACI|nr:uncharacterized protein LOC103515469 [Diaphorina citri]